MIKQTQIVFTLDEIVEVLNKQYPSANIKLTSNTEIEIKNSNELVIIDSYSGDGESTVETSTKEVEVDTVKPKRTRRTKEQIRKDAEKEVEKKPSLSKQETLDLVKELNEEELDPFDESTETSPVAKRDNTGSVPENLEQIDAAIAEADSASLDDFD